MIMWPSDREPEVPRPTSGADTAEIAATLYLSRGAGRNHLDAIATIVTKLGARNRFDAIRVPAESDGL
jgi:two-component system response regulator DesR